MLGEMGDLSAVPGLRALAEQDTRIVTFGSFSPSTGDDRSWKDDALRAAMARTASELARRA